MRVLISTRHGTLSQETQDKIAERTSKLSRHKSRLSAVALTVDLRVEDKPHVTGHAFTNHAVDLVASHTTNNLWAAVDHVVASLQKQLQRRKDKLTRLRRKTHPLVNSVPTAENSAVSSSPPNGARTPQDDARRNLFISRTTDRGNGQKQDESKRMFTDAIGVLELAIDTVHETYLNACRLLHEQVKENDRLRVRLEELQADIEQLRTEADANTAE